MFGIINPDSRLGKAFNALADMFVASVLWIICSLPLFTIGTSTVALYYTMMRTIRSRGSVFQDFIRAFKQNFKQGSCLTLLGAAIAAIMLGDFWMMAKVEVPGQNILQIVLYGVILLVVMLVSYLLPLMAHFEAPLKKHIQNAFLLSVSSPGTTLIVVAVNIAPVLLWLLKAEWYFRMLPFFVLLWTGGAAYLNSWLMLKLFENIQPSEEKDVDTEAEEM